mgnify:CR=1 FL=1
MGGADADFLPSLKIEKTPSLGRHRERPKSNPKKKFVEKFLENIAEVASWLK